MKKRCILIRHAKTKGNDEKRYIGANTDEELSKSGIEQAERRKDDILKLVTKNTQVFSSPMKRALQTAKLLFEDMSITVIKDLKETDFGLFEGKTYDDLKDDSDYQLSPDGAFLREMAAGNASPQELVEADDLQLLIDMVVDNMPSQRQAIYRMSREEGLSNEQIAEKMGLQKKTVENHINLALRDIREMLKILILLLTTWV